MNTIGYLLIFFGGLAIRQLSRGRAMDIGKDLGDAWIAIATGDGAALKEIADRSGNALDTGPIVGSAANGDTGAGTPATGLVAEMEKLGKAAKGYRLGSTGPDYYDCSGLVWRAVKNLGYYNGIRFTTATYAPAFAGWTTKIANAEAGDIVVWPTHHMGVVTGANTFYSARNKKVGIKEGNIRGFSGIKPVYYRVKAK